MVLSEWCHTCCYITIFAIYNILHCANGVWMWYTDYIRSGPISKELCRFVLIYSTVVVFYTTLFPVLEFGWHSKNASMHCISDIYIIKMYMYLEPECIIHFHTWELLNQNGQITFPSELYKVTVLLFTHATAFPLCCIQRSSFNSNVCPIWKHFFTQCRKSWFLTPASQAYN